jgi:hypothetical protein
VPIAVRSEDGDQHDQRGENDLRADESRREGEK